MIRRFANVAINTNSKRDLRSIIDGSWLGAVRCNLSTVPRSSDVTLDNTQDTASTSNSAEQFDAPSTMKLKKISRAVRSYLETSRKNDEFVKRELEEYELGKRHLANMMGMDSDAMTQEDIDKAVDYLFPSGLFSPRSRPVMKHPDKLFPKQKVGVFDLEGRPTHVFYYTLRPNFYQILYDIEEKLHVLYKLEDDMFERKGSVIVDEQLWVNVDELKVITVEKVNEIHHAQLIAALENVLAQPFSAREEEFIMKFRIPLSSMQDVYTEIPVIEYNEEGRAFAKAIGTKKHCTAHLTLFDNGSGKISIDGEQLEDLYELQSKEIILYPFIMFDVLGKYDVIAETSFGDVHVPDWPPYREKHRPGEAARAGAVRLAISRALAAFMPPERLEQMRLSGLLTRDPRRRERNKVEHVGPRARRRWLKR